jgi:general secretion pathway protein A
MLYAVKEHKPGVLLIGGYGTGKTFLSRALRERCPDDKFKFVNISNPRLNPNELLEEINFQLQAATPLSKPFSKNELLRIFSHVLEENFSRGLYSVVIVDEIQSVEDNGILEELRLLLNIQKDNAILFTLILLGQPAFFETIDKIPQFKQRLPVRYCLNPLSEDETARYIRYRLEIAGQSREIFTKESYRAIYGLSGGVPRIVNNICDLALLTGFINNMDVIDEPIITQVTKDMEKDFAHKPDAEKIQ